MRDAFTYPNAAEQFRRAAAVIPSGIVGPSGPAEGGFLPVDAFPLFSSRAQGTYFWDIDGHRFIDYLGAFGPNILGYGDPDVEEAAAKQRARGDCTTAPSLAMIDLAELLAETVASADWTLFAESDRDVTTLAVTTARAFTRRKKIVCFGNAVHGGGTWAQQLDSTGIMEEDVQNTVRIRWNDSAAAERVFAEYAGGIAAVIAQPYLPGQFTDSELPADGFWKKIRKLCTDNGALLILDDTLTGFRLDLAGSDRFFGFEADLLCFSSVIANGYGISALCGRDFLKTTAASLSHTGICRMSSVSFAAGIACIEKMKKLGVPKLLTDRGAKLGRELTKAAADFGFNLRVTGVPSLFCLRLADDPSLMLHQEWIAECVKRGVFFSNHRSHCINAALTDADIAETVDIARDAFQIVRERQPEK